MTLGSKEHCLEECWLAKISREIATVGIQKQDAFPRNDNMRERAACKVRMRLKIHELNKMQGNDTGQ